MLADLHFWQHVWCGVSRDKSTYTVAERGCSPNLPGAQSLVDVRCELYASNEGSFDQCLMPNICNMVLE